MDDIRELLGLWQSERRSSASIRKIARGHIDELKDKIVKLQCMVRMLEHLVHHCHGDHRPECPILDDLAGKMGRSGGATDTLGNMPSRNCVLAFGPA